MSKRDSLHAGGHQQALPDYRTRVFYAGNTPNPLQRADNKTASRKERNDNGIEQNKPKQTSFFSTEYAAKFEVDDDVDLRGYLPKRRRAGKEGIKSFLEFFTHKIHGLGLYLVYGISDPWRATSPYPARHKRN